MKVYTTSGIPELLNSGRKHSTLDSGRWTLDVGPETQDSGHWNLDTGLWTLDSGRWMLHFRRLALDTGHYR